jgi:hypothetical protein
VALLQQAHGIGQLVLLPRPGKDDRSIQACSQMPLDVILLAEVLGDLDEIARYERASSSHGWPRIMRFMELGRASGELLGIGERARMSPARDRVSLGEKSDDTCCETSMTLGESSHHEDLGNRGVSPLGSTTRPSLSPVGASCGEAEQADLPPYSLFRASAAAPVNGRRARPPGEGRLRPYPVLYR